MQKLSKRLFAVASLVNDGARVADVGCDHGYVPVYLAEQGVSPSAVACDINEGPLNSCRLLVSQCGLEDKIKCVLSDGLQNVSPDDYDDIIIAGMGGELTASILSHCRQVTEKHIVLNPMSHPELARKWLYENGFEIGRDFIIEDGGHWYSIFDARYTGKMFEPDDIECFVGKIDDFSQKEYFVHLLNYLRNKQKGGTDYSRLINYIEEKL